MVLLAAILALALGSGAAWPAARGGHAGGGFAGGRPGMGPPRGRGFEGGRRVPHLHGGPRVFVFPYFYDPYYPYAAYCDPYSLSYAPQYCYWDGP